MGPAAGPATKDNAFTYKGFAQYFAASSVRQITAAAEPSETPLQSNTPRSPATSGALAMVSIETSFWYCARGLRAPFWWFLNAIRLMTSLSWSRSTPYLCAYDGARKENAAGEERPGSVPSPTARMPVSPE